MRHISLSDGRVLSYDQTGSGPPLVLVHGSFSDHFTNWEFVRSDLQKRFTVYAIARRGRGETTPTEGHTIDEESGDVVALIHSIGEPVFLLGHSYGALLALSAAGIAATHIRKLVLYEPPTPKIFTDEAMRSLEARADRADWDDFAHCFFSEVLLVPGSELDALRTSELWPPIVADAKASVGDIRGVHGFAFQAARFRNLAMPVLLQIGTESPRNLYLTDALAGVLPDVRIGELHGQAHEGMTTAPEQYAESVIHFLS